MLIYRKILVSTCAVMLLGAPIPKAFAAQKSHEPRWYKPEGAITGADAPKARTENSRCSSLEADYEDASKHLSLNAAEDIADNSAIRSASRHADDQATLEKARITLDLMAGNKCKMPTGAPDARRYLTPALTCATDEYRAISNSYLTGQVTAPTSCNMATWTPSQS